MSACSCQHVLHAEFIITDLIKAAPSQYVSSLRSVPGKEGMQLGDVGLVLGSLPPVLLVCSLQLSQALLHRQVLSGKGVVLRLGPLRLGLLLPGRAQGSLRGQVAGCFSSGCIIDSDDSSAGLTARVDQICPPGC